MSERLWFKSWEVRSLTGLTERQLGYCVRTSLAVPLRRNGDYMYSWYDLFELYAIAKLREAGESLQKIRSYFGGVRSWLHTFSPDTLKLHTLIVRLGHPGRDLSLVQSEGYVKCVTPVARVYVPVPFNALAAAVLWADSHKDRGITIKDVAVA